MGEPPQRRSPRLREYDYAQAGAYFVTICTHGRAHLFGHGVDGELLLNRAGEIAHAEWERAAPLRPYVELDTFVIMPNHVHGILGIVDVGDHDADGRRDMVRHVPTTNALPDARLPREFGKPIEKSLSTIVGAYKSAVTKRIRAFSGDTLTPIWQPRFHDHIIRNEQDLHRIREYIVHNPARWSQDVFFSP